MFRFILFSFLVFSQSLIAQSVHRQDFPNMLDLRTEISKTDYVNMNVFSDLGAWHAYAFPNDSMDYGGFSGPLVMEMSGQWISKTASKLVLKENGKQLNFAEAKLYSKYFPGMLEMQYDLAGLRIRQRLIFVNNRQSMIETLILNMTNQTRKLNVGFTADFFDNGELSSSAEQLKFQVNDSKGIFVIDFDRKADIHLINNNYFADLGEISIQSYEQAFLIQSHSYKFKDEKRDEKIIKPNQPNFELELQKNESRWNDYLTNYFSKTNGLDETKQRLAVKSIVTLMTNWRSAAGDLLTDGVFPSVSYQGFYGFWSWDSWKQAVAISLFHPELAKNNIRSMFDYTDEFGMVADCIYFDKTENNWRDTKPPLSAWAVWTVFENTADKEFLKEMFPLLVKYHKWWYRNRDHDKNGLCEYGSTDGTLVAAAWESGMDNAVRFDNLELVQNNEHAWSLKQESVDLNAYLYAEKMFLSKIANQLGWIEQENEFKTEAENLAELIRKTFYDTENKYFYDRKTEGSKELVKVGGPEGWISLWAGLANQEQSEGVMRKMMNPTKFNTKVPLPTLAIDHPEFNPQKGYWRGPVWLDQFYFGIRGLKNYGYEKEADHLVLKLFGNCVGLMGDSSIYENYHPLTGQGLNARNFSWSAAHILMLLSGK